ncbi:MAG: 50S ribosomal protein L30e [Candidatus Diapherotrites archaeon]
MDANKEIRRAVDTGKIVFGFQETEKNSVQGKAQLIILTNNLEKAKKEKLIEYGKLAKIPCIEFNGNSKELGSVCGKPFIVSVMGILDKGKSNVLELAK